MPLRTLAHPTLTITHDPSPARPGPVALTPALRPPLQWLWWRIVETMFRVQFGLKGDLLPKSPIELDVFGGGQILTYDFRNMLNKKQVAAVKGSITSYDETSVTLADGTKMDVDVVVYGTGFKKSYQYLDRLLQNRLSIDHACGPWVEKFVFSGYPAPTGELEAPQDEELYEASA